jgi:polyvinyl alcohol dehydrogenase (cytochrome)
MTGTSGTEFSGGIAAFDLKSGERLWYTPFVPPDPSKTDYRGQRAAISLIPGVVFGGGYDGVLRAVSTVDGRILWQYNTIREFETVNGVAAKGGSMGSAGPTVVGGMLFVGSGYYYSSTGGRPGIPGNVLLAFGLD